MIRRLAGVALVGCVACTDVGTDPNAVVALRFEGSAYPSIVVEDSLRDSLGALQPLVATALNYRNEPVADAPMEFSSPDTALRVFEDGVVFARLRTAGASPARVFATTGSLQSQPDSLLVVLRADSIAADSVSMTRPTGATVVPDSITFRVLAPGEGAGAPTAAVGWLVSFQLRFHGQLLDPTDTTAAYTFTGALTRRVRSFVDTTSSAGSVSRGLIVRCQALATGPDSVIVIATIRDRRPGNQPKSAQTVVRVQRGTCQ